MTDTPYHLHKGDLPDDIDLSDGDLAVDCEMMGLNVHRDRLCLVQLKSASSDVHLVQIAQDQIEAPNLKAVLENEDQTKIFHFGRSDVAMLMYWLDIHISNIFCTRTASRLARTYSNRHGLRDVCRDILDIELSKYNQTSDWGAEVLSDEQLNYAASDVLYLHTIKENLVQQLEREDRLFLIEACNEFIPVRAAMDVLAYNQDDDIFAHS